MNRLLCILMTLFILGCVSKKEKVQSHSHFFENTNGKYLHSIDSVANDKALKSKNFVFIFNYYDCQTCVEAGFVYVKKLDSLLGASSVISVASMTDPTQIQAKANYYEYVYFDEKDKIRKELKFVPTPILLLIDEKRKIVLSFMPKDTIGVDSFVHEILNKYNEP